MLIFSLNQFFQSYNGIICNILINLHGYTKSNLQGKFWENFLLNGLLL